MCSQMALTARPLMMFLIQLGADLSQLTKRDRLAFTAGSILANSPGMDFTPAIKARAAAPKIGLRVSDGVACWGDIGLGVTAPGDRTCLTAEPGESAV